MSADPHTESPAPAAVARVNGGRILNGSQIAPTSGSKAPRWAGTGSSAPWPFRSVWTRGRSRGCSECSTWSSQTATSVPSTPNTTTNYWRPVTAIREAATDGNPLTTADPTWTPLVTTPPIPDYDSAHAVEGGAAAAVFAGVLSTDRIGFATCSLTLPAGQTCADQSPVLRHYGSFSQTARENALSRIYIGFHVRDADQTGTRHGEKIGNHTVNRFFRSVP